MDTLQDKEAMQNLPFREDGTIDLVELGRRQLEAMVNQITVNWELVNMKYLVVLFLLLYCRHV